MEAWRRGCPGAPGHPIIGPCRLALWVRPVPRSPRLAYLAPALLAAVAVAQFAVAQTTSLSPWKLGGFGMFSTADEAGARILRVRLETEAGPYVVVGEKGSLWTRTWPRSGDLQAAARAAVCAPWRFVPYDSLGTAEWPSPYWEAFYGVEPLRQQTEVVGFALPPSQDPTAPPPGRTEVRAGGRRWSGSGSTPGRRAGRPWCPSPSPRPR